jgi:hypothetical protein
MAGCPVIVAAGTGSGACAGCAVHPLHTRAIITRAITDKAGKYFIPVNKPPGAINLLKKKVVQKMRL